jgi:hypothetical protein
VHEHEGRGDAVRSEEGKDKTPKGKGKTPKKSRS